MAKLYKIEMYILDTNEYYSSLDEIIENAEMGADEANFNCFNVKEKQVEWNDDIDINMGDSTVDVYRKYFE